ncbi:hypothetical protein AMJ57_00325 [Parcubacteria bacterium SG8_24]|nr:MAG: hypothetical protein AMJ57_00325 [Parcubacteria bacterium SG8_24]
MASSDAYKRHQGIVLAVVLLIGAVTLVFAFLRVKRNIYEPLERDPSYVFKTLDEQEAERLAALRAADTDQDGLNDYDELYIFRTSPFLEDSDSDTIPDGIEVAQGQDPNCPRGKTCRQTGSSQPATGCVGALCSVGTSSASIPSDTGSLAQAHPIFAAIETYFGDLETLTPDSMVERLEEMPSDELRSFLITLGFPKQELDKASDEVLRAMLRETLVELQPMLGQAPVVEGMEEPLDGEGEEGPPAEEEFEE